MEVDELDFLSSSTLHRCVRSVDHGPAYHRRSTEGGPVGIHPLPRVVLVGAAQAMCRAVRCVALDSASAPRTPLTQRRPVCVGSLRGRRMGWLNERTAGGSEATAAVAQGSEWHAADDVRHSRGRSHPAAVRTWAEDVFSAGCLSP